MRVLLLSALLLFAGDDPRQTFLNLINSEREKLGLQPLALDPDLNAAAQAHVDDMGARNYAGFSSPEGRTTEDWVRDAGYKFQTVTAKLAFTADPPEAIAKAWKPESNRNSLFHPEVRDLGIGIGVVRGTPMYSFVLAHSEKSYLDRYIAELYEKQTLALENVEALREELLQRVNQVRAEAKQKPLSRHPALDRAAQEHAEAVLQAIRAQEPLSSAGPLVAKVKLQRYRSAGFIGERIVTEALDPEQAMTELLDENGESVTLLGKGFQQMGVGLAYERVPDGFRVVWVQCLARPAVRPTGADSRQDGQENAAIEVERNAPGGDERRSPP